jgi:monofunctional biosynthetic peptidoglycan transglycosylase
VKQGWRRRLVRWLLIAGLAAFVLTAAPVVAMRWINPWYSAFMLDAALDARAEGRTHYKTDYRWANFEHISPYAGVAVIASEDQFFPYHNGFDFKSIRAAMEYNQSQANRRKPRMRGASTISQQVAKNLFLWSGRGWLRKGLEAYFTVLIEWTWPKQRILEVYLNIAQFGDGIYGVESASLRFWHKHARQLNREEAATLAAVLPSPVRFRANAPSNYIVMRRDQILAQMRGLGGTGYLTELASPTGPPTAGTRARLEDGAE